jgi:raffinose/stachyose/melibiose transport system substrate-binding protein
MRMAALLMATGLLAAGCNAGGSPAADPTTVPTVTPTVAPTAAPTDAAVGTYEACAGAATTPITLTAWDRESGEAISAAIDQANAEFEAANPGVTITRVTKPVEELAAAVATALADPSGPDVVQVEPGREGMGSLVAAGLLLPLTEPSASYRWDKRWGPRLLARSSYSSDGRLPGTGTLYGVSLTGEIVGLFFNDTLGHTRTAGTDVVVLEDLLVDDFDLLREADMVPLVFGAADGGAVDVYASILGSMVEPAWLDDLVYARDGATFEAPETIAAAKTLRDVVRNGDVVEGYEELTGEEAAQWCASGTGQFLWAGSSLAADLETAEPTIYFYAVPPASTETPATQVGDLGMSWAIRRDSSSAACAAAYLDFLTGDRTARLLASKGVLPSHVVSGHDPAGEPFYGVAFAYFDAVVNDALGHRLQSAFPGAAEVIQANLSKLLAGDSTPEQFVKAVDAEYQAYLATLD